MGYFNPDNSSYKNNSSKTDSNYYGEKRDTPQAQLTDKIIRLLNHSDSGLNLNALKEKCSSKIEKAIFQTTLDKLVTIGRILKQEENTLNSKKQILIFRSNRDYVEPED